AEAALLHRAHDVHALGYLRQRERAIGFALHDAHLRATALRRVSDRRAADRLALRRDLADDRAVPRQPERDRRRIVGAGRNLDRTRAAASRMLGERARLFLRDADHGEASVLIGDRAARAAHFFEALLLILRALHRPQHVAGLYPRTRHRIACGIDDAARQLAAARELQRADVRRLPGLDLDIVMHELGELATAHAQ